MVKSLPGSDFEVMQAFIGFTMGCTALMPLLHGVSKREQILAMEVIDRFVASCKVVLFRCRMTE